MSVDNEKKNTQEEKNDKTKFIARSQKIGPEKNVEKSKIEPVSVKEINKEDNRNDKSHTKRPESKTAHPSTRTEVNTAVTGENNSPGYQTLEKGHLVKNRYVIDSLIGHGGLCDVYRAKDKVLESSGVASPFVALKVLQHEYIDQPETARMLIREAQHTQTLSHPNIIRVFDFGVDNKIYFIVMEYLDGETIEQLIQRSRPNGLAFPNAKVLLNQILDALIYAHSLDIVHADLKPANIMIDSAGTVKLLDFGVSKTERLKQDQYAAKRKVDDHQVLGYTPNYASLNIISGNKPCRQDDLFAFACIAYELLSCKHPYNRTPIDLAKKNAIPLKKPSGFPNTLWPDIKTILTDTSGQYKLSAESLKQRLNQNNRSKYAIAALIVLGLSTSLGVAHHLNSQIVQLEETNRQLAHSLQTQQQIINSQPESVFELSASDTIHPVLRAGLLRHHKQTLLATFEQQIDEILNQSNNEYPDYDQVESVLKHAAIYYPDSHKLELLNLDMRSSKRSTLLSIERHINSVLEKGQYDAQQDGKSIVDLHNDLHSIQQNYPLTPSSLATEVFYQNIDQAIEVKDSVRLTELLAVGGTFFSTNEISRKKLQNARVFNEAVIAIDSWQKQPSNSDKVKYPSEAVIILYGDRLSEIYQNLEKAATVSALDQVVVDIEELAREFPMDIPNISDLRFQTANKYLKFSDMLLKKRQSVSARNAMKKANELLQQVDSTDFRG
ncbi:TPA: serine/threonine protein kinase [Vibrio vulnificus]|nr:serine/threonine protein kinase [Vibrio vulnificus]